MLEIKKLACTEHSLTMPRKVNFTMDLFTATSVKGVELLYSE